MSEVEHDARPAGSDDVPEPGAVAPESKATVGGSRAAPAEEPSPEVLHDRWLRAEADLQNFRRRARRELEDTRRFAEEGMLLELIELLDDLERAVAAAGEAGAPDSWTSGVKLVVGRMQGVLARHGVGVLDAAGAAFDPELHEAMLEIEASGETPPGHVAQVVRKGYRRHGRVLRAARVVVVRASDGTED